MQEVAANNLINGTGNSSTLAQDLVLYVQSTVNLNGRGNSTVPISRIDDIVSGLGNTSIVVASNSSFLISQPVNASASTFMVGAMFTYGRGGGSVSNMNRTTGVIDSSVTAAATVNNQTLSGVTSISMYVIGEPVLYENIDTSTNKTLASSVIVASVQRTTSVPIIMELFFKVLPEYAPPSGVDGSFQCSFYDSNTSSWKESGCSLPTFSATFQRYECNCNHTTSFALIWLPAGSALRASDRSLRPVDIASLVFQSVSIVCFIAIIIHALLIRCINPLMRLRPSDLLPLISGASTTLLFAFYIALGMTVYTRTSSANETQCFLSSSVLMFFVYFFLIFMFCAKTSVGYFNYLRFVYLFPQPSYRRLFILLLISFLLSIGWTSFAAGFNSNASFHITQLYPYRICWFTRDVIYYFVTIPVCIFLLLNLITMIFVAKSIINHARNATSRHQSYERAKRCVLVLLSSCVTQGVGWLLGPFISFVDPAAGQVLEWFFVVFNGLEGVWSILLYIIIRTQRMDEQKRATAVKERTKTSNIASDNYRTRFGLDDRGRRSSARKDDTEITHRNVRRQATPAINDLNENRTIHAPVTEDDTSSL